MLTVIAGRLWWTTNCAARWQVDAGWYHQCWVWLCSGPSARDIPQGGRHSWLDCSTHKYVTASLSASTHGNNALTASSENVTTDMEPFWLIFNSLKISSKKYPCLLLQKHLNISKFWLLQCYLIFILWCTLTNKMQSLGKERLQRNKSVSTVDD